jgi:hypothetical protein
VRTFDRSLLWVGTAAVGALGLDGVAMLYAAAGVLSTLCGPPVAALPVLVLATMASVAALAGVVALAMTWRGPVVAYGPAWWPRMVLVVVRTALVVVAIAFAWYLVAAIGASLAGVFSLMFGEPEPTASLIRVSALTAAALVAAFAGVVALAVTRHRPVAADGPPWWPMTVLVVVAIAWAGSLVAGFMLPMGSPCTTP